MKKRKTIYWFNSLGLKLNHMLAITEKQGLQKYIYSFYIQTFALFTYPQQVFKNKKLRKNQFLSMSFILIIVCHAIFYARQPSFIKRWEFLNLQEVKLNSITFQL